jgi:AhpD family alkylhydroperoxidase
MLDDLAAQQSETRIPPVEVAALPPDLCAVLDEQRAIWGAPLHPYLYYARNGAYFRAAHAMWVLQEGTMRTPAALRALINRRVAAWNRCDYCQDAHAAKAARFGVANEKIEALADFAASPLFSDAERVALEYADAITDTAADVDDALFGRLKTHYDDDAIAELTMVIAWQNASSRFNHALRIPSQGFWKR